MRARSVLLIALMLVVQLGMTCSSGVKIKILSPASNLVNSCDLFVEFELVGAFDLATLEVELNFQPIHVTGGPVYTAIVDPGFPLAAENFLLVRADRTSDGVTMTSGRFFDYEPPLAALRVITDPADLIDGPLAHGSLGDYLLENGCARFIIQKPAQRELSSIGTFGGNLIDAEVVVNGVRQGRDNFMEVQPGVNVETVVNAQTVLLVNDGSDGNPAVVRMTGRDDLLDSINPSSVVGGVGGQLPPGVDDQDYDLMAWTEYSLAPGNRYVTLTTTIDNLENFDLNLGVGDYINGSGELEQITPPANALIGSAGVGEILATFDIDSMSFFGFDSAEGTSYALVTPQPPLVPEPSSSFTTSGVSYVLHGQSIPSVVGFGEMPFFEVLAGQTNSFTRWFGVGRGSAAIASQVQAEVLGLDTGMLRGCVTDSDGAPLPGARVIAAGGNVGQRNKAHFVTGDDGCYSGPVPARNYRVAASKQGFMFEGGLATPTLTLVTVPNGGTVVHDMMLPESGRLRVVVTDGSGAALPARVSVVGFDPSPEPLLLGSVLSSQDSPSGQFYDITRDGVPSGLSRTEYTEADGVVEFDLEPEDYQIAVSRGTEYSVFTSSESVAAGSTTLVEAKIARVLDTPDFISSDYHVHMIDSPDSSISQRNRALSFAGEGVENLIATDHNVVTDMNPAIAEEGLAGFVHATAGEEITTFDTGHYNSFPQGLNASAVQTRGSTDWGGAAPPGEDFPSFMNYILDPPQIEALILGDLDNAGLETVIQINHFDDHFGPLQIDTALVPPASQLDPGSFFPPGDPINPNGPTPSNPMFFRLDPTRVAEYFAPFDALEVWNGMNINHQDEFLVGRIGVWMNLLNQGFVPTAIADTDSHTFHNLRTGGARSWTPSSSDLPSGILDAEIGQAVKAGKLVGGQGLYVQARLSANAGASSTGFELADPTLSVDVPTVPGQAGVTVQRPGLTAGSDDVDLIIDIQAPLWAPYDTIEIYTNSATSVTGTAEGTSVQYTSVPDDTLTTPGDFSVDIADVDEANVPGASRLETRNLVVPLTVTVDTWVVVVVKGTQGDSKPMFPVFPFDVEIGAEGSGADNETLADLMNVTAAEDGIRALGFTNALFVDRDGNGKFDAPIPVP